MTNPIAQIFLKTLTIMILLAIVLMVMSATVFVYKYGLNYLMTGKAGDFFTFWFLMMPVICIIGATVRSLEFYFDDVRKKKRGRINSNP